MATRTKMIDRLGVNSGSDYTITDGRGNLFTVEEARAAWEAGRIKDYNLALKRLASLSWDVEALKAHFAAGKR